MSSQIVTIKKVQPVYRDNQEAISIERIELNENSFDIISGKNIYKEGDKALYINPDWCLPEKDSIYGQKLFIDYIEPNGKSENSKLGKNRRIRAIKFNFNNSLDSLEPIYSNGLLLPISYVVNATSKNIEELEKEDISSLLGIVKYEEPEGNGQSKIGQSKGSLPSGMYSTDETNILSKRIEYPITLNASVKVDGSSITIYVNDEDYGICSRNLNKRLFIDVLRNENKEEIIKISYNGQVKYKNIKTEEILDFDEKWETTKEKSNDVFVITAYPYLEKIIKYKEITGRNIVLRGELYGKGLKGSGNKHNPHSKLERNIYFFGVDEYINGVTKKLPIIDFNDITNNLELPIVDFVFRDTFNNIDEIKSKCNDIFTYYKNNGSIIEGLVLRNDDCSFSAKYMNPEYDSKK